MIHSTIVAAAITQTMVDCKAFSEKRYKCHAVYGKMGEDCLNEELSEKRCLSLHHCPRQAKEYYGDAAMSLESDDGQGAPVYMSQKSICASWAEAFAYTRKEKELEYGTVVTEHHQKAREIVNNDKDGLKRQCRDVAFNLAQCLRRKKLF